MEKLIIDLIRQISDGWKYEWRNEADSGELKKISELLSFR